MQQAAAISLPVTPLTNPDFAYASSVNTNVVRTFQRNGWTPPDRAVQREMKQRLNRLDDAAVDALDTEQRL